ncbi:MAG: hypothetical protein M1822_009011 [Bathelium mastoideum]|nr:MAG: hypothetical protein M1822_009011 [Bathelium mastoideum]
MVQPPVSAQARLTIQHAFDRFSASVTPEDRRDFNSAALQDVRNAALLVEKQLAARRSLRNMRRLQPFMHSLEHYSRSIEVLCNGTPYLPWIWASIKLMLQVSSDYLKAFESLIDAYGKIADALPRFDRLNSALKENHNFQAILAFFYADIVEFHRRAYKFVRRKSWQILFTSTWGHFESRFSSILASLAYHGELVDKEAAAIDISYAAERRERQLEQWEKAEAERQAAQLNRVMAWLGLCGTAQVDELDRISRICSPGSCDWILKHKKITAWLDDSPSTALIWLHGKPGAGKSVLCSYIVRSVKPCNPNIFYYFCNYRNNTVESSAHLFRSLTAQIIQTNPDLMLYIHNEYVQTHPTASMMALRELLPKLLQTIDCSHVLVDGIDECNTTEQKYMIEELLTLLSSDPPSYTCKILISSRDVPTVSRSLRKKAKAATVLSLSDEEEFLNHAIECFVHLKMSELQDELTELDPAGKVSSDIHRMLVEKANGMFLWVSLVLYSLDTVYSLQELRDKIKVLPSDLSQLYGRILTRICNHQDPLLSKRTMQILGWICCSQRSLKRFELLPALAITSQRPTLDDSSMPSSQVFDTCKPLVEVRNDGSVTFVHFSVKEFLLTTSDNMTIKQIDVHHDLALTCVVTLKHGLDLIDPRIADSDRLLRICSGLYGLLPYAIDHWIEHLLTYVVNKDGLGQDELLSSHLSDLTTSHNQLWTEYRLDNTPTDRGGHLSGDEMDRRLELLSDLPIHSLITKILHIRSLSHQENSDNGQAAEEYALDHDQTLFSQLSISFDKAVINLLSSDNIVGLPKERLDAFKKSYASSAFRCRYPFCRKGSMGFGSDQLRTEHEKTHMRRVFCTLSDCSYSRIGFLNKKGLSTHLRSHREQAKIPIPAKVRQVLSDPEHRSTPDRSPSKLDNARSSLDQTSAVSEASNIDEAFDKLSLEDTPERFKEEGQGWFCLYNLQIPRQHRVRLL